MDLLARAFFDENITYRSTASAEAPDPGPLETAGSFNGTAVDGDISVGIPSKHTDARVILSAFGHQAPTARDHQFGIVFQSDPSASGGICFLVS